jgi:hypothetical protein
MFRPTPEKTRHWSSIPMSEVVAQVQSQRPKVTPKYELPEWLQPDDAFRNVPTPRSLEAGGIGMAPRPPAGFDKTAAIQRTDDAIEALEGERLADKSALYALRAKNPSMSTSGNERQQRQVFAEIQAIEDKRRKDLATLVQLLRTKEVTLADDPTE